jgi:hypothetical protein
LSREPPPIKKAATISMIKASVQIFRVELFAADTATETHFSKRGGGRTPRLLPYLLSGSNHPFMIDICKFQVGRLPLRATICAIGSAPIQGKKRWMPRRAGPGERPKEKARPDRRWCSCSIAVFRAVAEISHESP